MQSLLKRVWRFLRRMDVASALIAIVLLLAALGSCFPQLSPLVAQDAERLARWESAVRARYGARTELLMRLGAFRFARSLLFTIPLGLLAAATLVCTISRWRGVWRRAFRQPIRCSSFAYKAAPFVAEVNTSLAIEAVSGALREGLRQRSFRVRTQVADDSLYLRGDRNRLAALGTLVNHLAVLLLLAGVLLTTGLAWQQEVTLGPGETAEVTEGKGLALRNDGFRIERYPDGRPAGYEAQVTLFQEGREVLRGPVRINEPMTYRGYGVYLRSYWGTEGHHNIVLLVRRDPGYVPFVLAGVLLVLGMTLVLYFPHCYVRAQLGPEGRLRLAGWAGRQACGFAHEFTAMTEEVRRQVDPRMRQQRDEGAETS